MHMKRLAAIIAFAACVQGAFGDIFTINGILSGLEEVPPNASPGTGTIAGTYDDVTNTLDFDLEFSGLLAGTTAAHFHAPAPPGVNAPVIIGFAGFPTGVTSGTFANSYVLTAGQESDLLANLVYVNVHSTQFPGGEIRTQLIPVPEPATAGLMTLAGLLLHRRR